MSATRRRLSLLVVLVLVAGCSSLLGGSALAHTAIIRAAPGPGAAVDAPVEEVRIEFLDPVEAADIVVSDATGVPVAGLATTMRPGTAEAVATFDPLDDVGTYRVDVDYVAADGEAQVDVWQFTIHTGDEPFPAVAVFGMAAGLAALAAVVVAAARRRARARRNPV